MTSNTLRLLLLMLTALGVYSRVWAQDCDVNTGVNVGVNSIAPGVYLRQGQPKPVFTAVAVANIGFIVGERCVAVIDSGGSLNEGRALRCAIKEITPRPICYIILTHMHPDHVLGAAALRDENTIVIGHAKLAPAIKLVGEYYLRRLQEFTGQSMSPADLVAPERGVESGQFLSLDLGQRTIVLQAHTIAHTNHDLSVYDETSQTLWAGDLIFLEHTPVVDGSSKGWLQVLQTLGGINAARVVPGHGPVREDWPQAAEPTRRYLEQLRQELRDWIDQGGDMLSAQNAIGQSLRGDWLLFDEYHKRNISKIYAELEWE